jgi:hypothetical protein
MDFGKLMSQFAPLAQMFQGGGQSFANPMGMLKNMMGEQRFNEFNQMLNQGRNSGQSPEDYVKQMFTQSGMDISQVRQALGMFTT